jgi:hypothetical protein
MSRKLPEMLSVRFMSWKTYFLVTGIIFALVALAHALRIYMEWPVLITGWSVPKSVSWIGLIVSGSIALSRLGSSQKMRRHERKERA